MKLLLNKEQKFTNCSTLLPFLTVSFVLSINSSWRGTYQCTCQIMVKNWEKYWRMEDIKTKMPPQVRKKHLSVHFLLQKSRPFNVSTENGRTSSNRGTELRIFSRLSFRSYISRIMKLWLDERSGDGPRTEKTINPWVYATAVQSLQHS